MRPVAPLYITTDYNRLKKILSLNGPMPNFSEDYFSPKKDLMSEHFYFFGLS